MPLVNCIPPAFQPCAALIRPSRQPLLAPVSHSSHLHRPNPRNARKRPFLCQLSGPRPLAGPPPPRANTDAPHPSPPPPPTVAPNAALPDARLPALRDWLDGAAVGLHSLTIGCDGAERALYATHSIRTGDILITVPRRAALLADDASAPADTLAFFRDLSLAFWQSTVWYIRLAIVVLDQCARHPASPFGPYLDALPPDPASALWMMHARHSPSVDTQLRRYHLDDFAKFHYSDTVAEFNAFRDALPLAQQPSVTLRSFMWAVSIAESRAFACPPLVPKPATDHPVQPKAAETPSQFALFPGLDMANHSIHAKTTLRYDADADAFELIAGVPSQPGEQVFISYGPRCNDDLVLFYGIVEAYSPANCVRLLEVSEWLRGVAVQATGGGLAEETVVKAKVAMMDQLCGGVDAQHGFAYRVDGIDDVLMQAMRIAVASQTELAEMRTSGGVQRARKTLSLANEMAAWNAIEDHVTALETQLAEYDEGDRDGDGAAGGDDSMGMEEVEALLARRPCSVAWQWGSGVMAEGEVLLRHERREALRATRERVRHFARVSAKVGRVCTVLLPPSQSVVRTEMFDEGQHGGFSKAMADVQMFDIHAEIQAQVEGTG